MGYEGILFESIRYAVDITCDIIEYFHCFYNQTYKAETNKFQFTKIQTKAGMDCSYIAEFQKTIGPISKTKRK
jgi:hypothetical protein